jgi:hypothetical protein
MPTCLTNDQKHGGPDVKTSILSWIARDSNKLDHAAFDARFLPRFVRMKRIELSAGATKGSYRCMRR